MKMTETLQRLIAELQESDRRFLEEVDGLIKSADKLIESIDQTLAED